MKATHHGAVGSNPGQAMHDLARSLFPICRSITGDGIRQTLKRLQEHVPEMTLHEVPSGQKAFDWAIPDEWNIRSARLVGPDGNIVADFATNNLHVVGYSIPVDTTLTLEELQTRSFLKILEGRTKK